MNLRAKICTLGIVSVFLSACDGGTWNNPNPSTDEGEMVLYSAFRERPKYLDPVRTYSADESDFIDQIYDPPLQYHYLKRPYELEPATLASMPELVYLDEQGNKLPDTVENPAFSLYTLELKPGILFQPHPSFSVNEDGSPFYQFTSKSETEAFESIDDFAQTGTKELISDDYIYQIKRLSDPKLVSPLRGLLGQYIVGMPELGKQIEEIRKQQGEDAWVDLRKLDLPGVEKISDQIFTIKLKGKYPQFKYWLAFHFFAPIPWQVDYFYHLPGLSEKNISLNWNPVGTGPFMMTKNNPNSEIVLERNPNYRADHYPSTGEEQDAQTGLLSDAGKTLPFIDKAIFRLEKESIPTWTKFTQGYYDYFDPSRGGNEAFNQALSISVNGIDLNEDMKARGIRLIKEVEPSTYYIGFNMLDPVVGGYSEKARKLRLALAIAYNEEEFLNIFMSGRGETAMSPVPPGIFGYMATEQDYDNLKFDLQNSRFIRKPIDVAKQLLAEAGYPNGRDAITGKPLLLNYDGTSKSDSNDRLNWKIKQFKKLGIQMNARITDYNRFKEKMETGNAQIYGWGWLADYPDPENFLFLLYGPNGQIATGGTGVNSANYSNPKYDKLFEQMRLMDDTPERKNVIREMVSQLRKDVPWMSSYHSYKYVMNNQWMNNVKPHGITKATLKYIKIDTEKRAEHQQHWNQPVVWPLAMVFVGVSLFVVPGVMAFRRRQSRKIGG